jgi:NAD(P)-dependent dehydrogenase (short-subunit alcohol dehydrogenase family)
VDAEITEAGGRAISFAADARESEPIIAAAVSAFGRIDALIVNAGITRDCAFRKMSPEDWYAVLGVHLDGAYRGCAAVWPYFVEQRAGSIVLTTSGAGLHGNIGQANYAAAKGGIISLAKSLALEGKRYGVRVNAVAPMALTDMTADVFGDGPLTQLSTEMVVPYVLALAHDSCPLSGEVIETGGGWAAAMRWECGAGVRLPAGATSADVAARWDQITNFCGSDTPTSIADSLRAACDCAAD